jgi:polar amino acid transport system substrate-binding protein
MGASRIISARKRYIGAIGTTAMLAFGSLLAGCASTPTADGTGTPSSASSSGSVAPSIDGFVQNGIKFTYIIDPPNVYQAENGDITGASAEAIKAVLAKLGITNLSYANVPFDSTIPTLTANRADLTSFIFNIKPDRCSQVAFTNPVYIDRDGAAVLKGNPKNIHSWDDLVSDKSIQIASIRGDAHLDWLKAYGIDDSRIQQFESLPQAVSAVATGRADVYLNGNVNIAGGLKQGGDGVELATPFAGPVIDGKEQVSIGGFAMSYDNIDLLNEVNATIADMIKSGELADIMDPLGYPKSGIPDATMTAKSICPDAPWPAGYVDLGTS